MPRPLPELRLCACWDCLFVKDFEEREPCMLENSVGKGLPFSCLPETGHSIRIGMSFAKLPVSLIFTVLNITL